MSPHFWRTATAIWAGVALALWFSGNADAQRPEGAMGYDADLPPIVGNETPLRDNGTPFGVVGMTGECAGYVIASGRVDAADHELESGYVNVNALSLSMRPESPWFRRLKELRDQPVEIVVRPLKPRGLEQVRR